MQKRKEKQNAKPVGANCIRPCFKGMTQNKGITLIALIITIIVMLILVGVTINVALNGGLFEKAETATKQTQIEAEKEELLSAVVAAIGTDAKVDFDYLDDNLPNNWDGENGTYTSPRENTYTVDENGKIEEKNSSGGSGDTPETDLPDGALITMYRAGENCEEENCTNEEHLHIGDYVSYTPDTTVTTYYPDGEDVANIGVNTGYTTAAGATTIQAVEQENLTWRVLGTEGDSVLLISGTPTATKKGGICFCGYVGYNNYETILNTACSTLYSKSGVGIARSIKMDDIDTYLDGNNYDKTAFNQGETLGYYGFTNTITSEWGYDSSSKTLSKLDEGSTATITLMSDFYYYFPNEYITDQIKLNLLQGDHNYIYWIADKFVYVDSDYASWGFGGSGGEYIGGIDFCICDSADSNLLQEWTQSLRPVVILNSDVTTDSVSKKTTTPIESWVFPYED